MDLSARWSWFARTFGPAIAIVVAQQILFPSKELNSGAYAWGLVVQGITLGMLGALVALGMALVYRANRILNFAQGDLGLLPVSLAIDLILFSSLNYFLAFFIGLAGAIVVGAVVELAIIRRFFHTPRLILSVATIGLAQLLAFGALALPKLWGEGPLSSSITIPITWRLEVQPLIFNANYAARVDPRPARDDRHRAVPPLHRHRRRHACGRRPFGPRRAAGHPGRATAHLRVDHRHRALVRRAVPPRGASPASRSAHPSG